MRYYASTFFCAKLIFPQTNPLLLEESFSVIRLGGLFFHRHFEQALIKFKFLNYKFFYRICIGHKAHSKLTREYG